MGNVSVERIVVKINGDTLNLTPTEAKELRDILNTLLGGSITVRKEYVPYPYPSEPYRWDKQPWDGWITYCSSDNKTAVVSLK